MIHLNHNKEKFDSITSSPQLHKNIQLKINHHHSLPLYQHHITLTTIIVQSTATKIRIKTLQSQSRDEIVSKKLPLKTRPFQPKIGNDLPRETFKAFATQRLITQHKEL